jgi:hypothetical protein
MKKSMVIGLLVVVVLGAGCMTQRPQADRQVYAIEKLAKSQEARLVVQEKLLAAQVKATVEVMEQVKLVVKSLNALKDQQQKSSRKLETALKSAQRTAGNGQSERGQDMMSAFRGRQLGQIGEALGLSEEQQKKAEVVMGENRDAIRKLFEGMRQDGGGPPDREKMGEAMGEARTLMENAMKDILTPEQIKKYEENREKWQQDFGNRGGRGRRGRRPNADKPDAEKGEGWQRGGAAE